MAEVPAGPVMVMSMVPAAPAGATAVMLTSLVTWKFGDGVPPKLTPVAPLKQVPAMVTVLPPAVGPASGLIEVMTGEQAGMLSAWEIVTWPWMSEVSGPALGKLTMMELPLAAPGIEF